MSWQGARKSEQTFVNVAANLLHSLAHHPDLSTAPVRFPL